MLKESEAQLSAILEASPVGVALISTADRVIRFCNQRLAQLRGETTDALIGQLPSESCQKVLRAWMPESTSLDTEAALKRADGSDWWGLISIRPISFQGQDAMLAWVHDITELHLARQQLEHLAHHDPLTGIPNRRQFELVAQQALAHARRFYGHGALLFIDLDGFKSVNDGYGHQIGDTLLQEVTAQLSKRLRRSDFIARLGGDEFAIIALEPKAVSEIDAFAQEIIAIISSASRVVVPDCEVSASIGIARFGAHGPDIATLMRRADDAMYRAKAAGKATIRHENTGE